MNKLICFQCIIIILNSSLKFLYIYIIFFFYLSHELSFSVFLSLFRFYSNPTGRTSNYLLLRHYTNGPPANNFMDQITKFMKTFYGGNFWKVTVTKVRI